jgi:hypothetical protein
MRTLAPHFLGGSCAGGGIIEQEVSVKVRSRCRGVHNECSGRL